MSEQVHDGIIIGGGISGLAFAHWLGLHDNPSTWELWEATGRLGGTTRTDDEFDVGPPDMGYHYARFASFCDLDWSGRVDGLDLSIFSPAFGAGEGDGRYDHRADFDGNGIVDGDDLVLFAAWFGTTV